MADVMKIISDLKGDFSGDNESQMKAVQLLKGLATSDDPKANEFMKKLGKATTDISTSMTKNESVIEVTEDVELPGTGYVLEAGDRIRVLQEAKTEQEVFYSFAASALVNGDYSGLSGSEKKSVLAFESWLKQNYGSNAHVVDVEDSTYFGKPSNGGLKGDVCTYTIMY